MNRQDVVDAIARLNDAITSLNLRLHPPPADNNVQAKLEAELAAAEAPLFNLEQILNNLPSEVSASISFITAAADAVIGLSQSARDQADNLTRMAGPLDPPVVTSGPKKHAAAARKQAHKET